MNTDYPRPNHRFHVLQLSTGQVVFTTTNRKYWREMESDVAAQCLIDEAIRACSITEPGDYLTVSVGDLPTIVSSYKFTVWPQPALVAERRSS